MNCIINNSVALVSIAIFYLVLYYTIHMYSGITNGRVLGGELLCTKILEVNLFTFAYRLFHKGFSPINGAYCICPVDWRETSMKQSVGKCKQNNF